MTVQELIDLLMFAGDKELDALIQPCENCGRHAIECVDIDDDGTVVLYMEEIRIIPDDK